MAQSIDPAAQTMIDNMPKNTGKSLTYWYIALNSAKLEKHGDIMNFLKGVHGVTHGYANTISILYRQHLSGGAPSDQDLVEDQFSGAKSGLRPIYDKIIQTVSQFGSDIEIAPKKTYVSLRRSKQFAIIQPATKDRVDLGFNLKGQEPTERLEGGNIFNGMCTHRVRLFSLEEVDKEVVKFLKQAYQKA